MGVLDPTPLESALLAVFYELYGSRGFPDPVSVKVRDRKNTGAGRYVYLTYDSDTNLEDGYLDLGGRFIQMNGVPNGLMAVARVRDHRVDNIEIAVYGSDPWDGSERQWAIV